MTLPGWRVPGPHPSCFPCTPRSPSHRDTWRGQKGVPEAAVHGKEVVNHKFIMGPTVAEIVTLNFYPLLELQNLWDKLALPRGLGRTRAELNQL